MHELGARGTAPDMVEDRITDGKRPRIASEYFQRFGRRAADPIWVWIVMQGRFLHVAENFFEREFVRPFVGHRPSMFAPFLVRGQGYS